MNIWSKKIYATLNVYERNVFGCFIDKYGATNQNILKSIWDLLKSIYVLIICKWHHYIKKDIYFRYFEVPITTRCSLNCAECNNLIQFYERPQNFKATDILRDIKRVCCVTERISMVRILGGEPLVHPDLAYILNGLKEIDKIQQVQIVTNGTLLFNEECLSIIRNKKFSVDVSNYGVHSVKYAQLIEQLRTNKIRYITQSRRKPWRSLSSCKCRGHNEYELETIFASCKEDCHSLLNGELHLCARSAHGTDLGVITKKEKEYVNVRAASGKKKLRKEIYDLLNRKSISACNYCDVYRVNSMKIVSSAEQISKADALKRLKSWKE